MTSALTTASATDQQQDQTPTPPKRPSKVRSTVTAILVGLVLLVATGTLQIPWQDLPTLPG